MTKGAKMLEKEKSKRNGGKDNEFTGSVSRSSYIIYARVFLAHKMPVPGNGNAIYAHCGLT